MQPIHSLLLVEDDVDLAEIFGRSMTSVQMPIHVVRSGQEALDFLAGNHEVLLVLDYALPDMTAETMLTTLSRTRSLPPFIIITGRGDERSAVSLMKLGARDYLVKDTLLFERLPVTVKRVLKEIQVESQLRESEKTLLRSRKELEAIYEHSPSIMLLFNGELKLHKANATAFDELPGLGLGIGGLSPGAALLCETCTGTGAACGTTAKCRDCCFRQLVLETLERGQVQRGVEVVLRTRAGDKTQERAFEMDTVRIEIDTSRYVLVCLDDITERKNLERKFRQAQKMEAIGQLAGGVAHDFNNILAASMLQLGLLLTDRQVTPQTRNALKELEAGMKKAASLTRQLLVFSRQQVVQIKTINLGEVVMGVSKMLRRVLGENIELQCRLGSQPLFIEGDTGMIEQVIMNLCINSRDAMPKGGTLLIELDRVDIDPKSQPEDPLAIPGQYVRMRVIDTGCGISEEHLPHVFEPFFTTKEPGQGTGLGLATVYGIVTEHKGWVTATSLVGMGTTISVHLPCSVSSGSNHPFELPGRTRGGTETILLVEDDAEVRSMIRLCLQTYGYRIIEAINGNEAIRHWANRKHEIDLLLTDMIMPEGITGLDLTAKLRETKPGLKVIIASGYSATLINDEVLKSTGARYLPKPFTSEILANVVRETLAGEVLPGKPA